MTNIFLRLAVSCLVWAPVHVRAAQVPTASCPAANGGDVQTQTYKVSTITAVRIACPAGTTLATQGNVEPNNGASTNVYPDNTGGGLVPLNKVMVGATYVQGGGHNELTVSQLPNKTATIYFRCNVNQTTNASCWIAVEVAAQPALGPQGCTVGGSQVTLTVTGPNQTALFACASGKNLLPATVGNVYEKDCKTEAALTSILPGSQLIRSADQMNQLKVTSLPQTATLVCLVCATGPEVGDDEKCKIYIDVSADDSQKGSAVGLTARTATALGVLLVGAAFSQYV